MGLREWTFGAMAGVAACSPAGTKDKPVDVAAPAVAASAPTAAAPAAAAAPVALPGGASMDKSTAATLGMTVSGEIVPSGPSNFYRFDNPLKQRDIVLVRLENKSATLKPDIKLYNADRSEIVDKYDSTPGASVQQLISLDPGQVVYVEVTPYGSAGAYQLSATPQKAYDAHEPNDDQLTPKAIPFGESIEGSIMDGRDSDWFRVSGAQSAKVNVVLENLSTTLKPDVKIYSSTKSEKVDKYDSTPGASLDFVAEIDAGKDFYVQVLPYGSTGKYKLSTKAAQ
jgi:hypothetical protein